MNKESNIFIILGEKLEFQHKLPGFGLVYWGLTPQQRPGSYQGGEIKLPGS